MIVSHTTGELYDIITLVHANARTDMIHSILLFVFCIIGLFAAYYTVFLKKLTYPVHLLTSSLSDDDEDDKEDVCFTHHASRPNQRHFLKNVMSIIILVYHRIHVPRMCNDRVHSKATMVRCKMTQRLQRKKNNGR